MTYLAGEFFGSTKITTQNGITSISTRSGLKQSICGNNKKSGPYNAYFLWLIANRWKGAPEAHYRIYPLWLKLSEHKLLVNKQYIEKQGMYDIRSVHDIDINVFSDSDIEALVFAIKHFGHLGQFQLAEVSHAYPEWKRFEKKLKSGMGSVFNMDYEDFFKDAMPGSKHLAPLEGKNLFVMNTDDKEEMLNYVNEQMEIKNQWEQIPD